MMALDPLQILELRAWARAQLFAGSQIATFGEAVGPLIEYAHETGLFDELGDDAVNAIISAPFNGIEMEQPL